VKLEEGNIQIDLVVGKLKGRARNAVETFISTISFVMCFSSHPATEQGIKSSIARNSQSWASGMGVLGF